jgi:hypothetical protein
MNEVIPTAGMIRSHGGNDSFPRRERFFPTVGITAKGRIGDFEETDCIKKCKKNERICFILSFFE